MMRRRKQEQEQALRWVREVNPPNKNGVGIAGREAMGPGGALTAFHLASSFSRCNAPASKLALSMRPCASTTVSFEPPGFAG